MNDVVHSSTVNVGHPALELVPGSLFVLGSTIELDGRVSWAPAEARGYQRVNCYLLLEGDDALLVDTGVPVHQRIVIEQLRSLLPERARLSIFLTRPELDAVGNVAAIARQLQVEHLHTGGVVNPFDSMDEIAATTRPPLRRLDMIGMERTEQGASILIGDDRKLEVLTAPLRMVTCFWAFDTRTGTLFSADTFGHHVLDDPFASPLDDDSTTLESLTASTKARYWWLDGSNVDVLRARVDDVFNAREVRRIAPTHGNVIDGPERVAEHRRLFDALLRAAGRMPLGARG